MPLEIKMPQLSDTMSEGTLVKWLKKEGDKVKEGEDVAEVETDKAVMPLECGDSGTLAVLLIKEGEKAPVGQTLALLATGKETVEDVKKAGRPQSGSPAPAAAPAPAPAAKPAKASPPPAAPPPPVKMTATMEEASSGEIHDLMDNLHGVTRGLPARGEIVDDEDGHPRVKASPLARRIAADTGVPLAKVTGTGPGGRIIQRDVLAYKQQSGGVAAAIAPGEKQIIPMTKLRSAIAAQLLKSKQTIPHFYETVDIDLEDLTHLRERMNARLEKENVRLSIADFIAKGVASALVMNPALNARFDAAKQEVTRYGDVNLGLAVAIPDGLIVPILRGVNRMDLREIRHKTADLVDRARQQRLRREEQTEGTFTISSLGTYGIREFAAIINPPEVAILSIGSAEKRAVVRDDQVVSRTMLSVTLSSDHRVVDGATAAIFLQTLKANLEDPWLMLM